VDLRALLEALRALDAIAVLAEGGGELGGALAEAGLVDRVAFFVAPRLLGGREAPGPLGGRGRSLKDAIALVDVVTRRLDEDLLVEADVRR
jgi:diaminohydroxyphosphoribosylaminopyrimidine deaminase/5-amino-6-(5-phosphoribosylamino)uracil reductase